MTRIGVIVLAAGRSTRFAASRTSKLLAPLRGVPLVRHAVTAALDADVGEVVVVTGDRAADIAASVIDLPIRVVYEPAFAEGMAVSLASGVRALDTANAVVITLGDLPEMLPEAYRRVVARWHRSGATIVVPRYAGSATPSHPTLFAASAFDELLALRGDVGARAVIVRDPSRVVEEPLEWPAPEDVDTPYDLERVTSRPASDFLSTNRPSQTIPSSDTDEAQ